MYKVHRIMEEKKIEGLLLQATPYLGTQKILKILTPSDGLITVMAKKRALNVLYSPFLIAEWVYRKGKGEIHTLKDATLICDLSGLRKNYQVITVAGQIAQDLLKTQWPEKPGSGPYLLAVAFLKKLELSSCPDTLLASFRLKLLLHDGFLALEEKCTQCNAPASTIGDGGSFCQEHAIFPIRFSPAEWEQLHHLTFGRQFQFLESLKNEKAIYEKIEQIFNYLMK